MVATLEAQSTSQESRDRPSAPRPNARRSWRWGIAGLVLVLGGAAGAVVLAEAEAQRVPVVAVARDIAAGQVLTAQDLRVVELAGAEGLDLVRADGDGVEGRRLAVPVRAGTPLVESALADEAGWPQEGRAVVAASLPAGAVPASVVPGSRVAVVTTGEFANEEGESAVARVHSRGESEAAGEVVVELDLPAELTAGVARAAAAREMRLVLVWQKPDDEVEIEGGTE